MDAGFDLVDGRAPPAANNGGLGFNVGVRYVAAFQLEHPAEAEPNRDIVGMALSE